MSLYHETDGQPDGTALVLLHPLGANLRFWDRCRALWAGRRRVVAYDRPGAGQSPAPPSPQTLAESVADLDALCEQLGLDSVVPVGVAIGAMIAAAYAARHPQRVAAAVLCNPATGLSEAGRAMTLARVQRAREGGVAALLPDIVDRAFHGLPQDAGYARYVEAFRGNDPIGYERNALGALDIDVTADLGRIRCPALVAVGRAGRAVPTQRRAGRGATAPTCDLSGIARRRAFSALPDTGRVYRGGRRLPRYCVVMS
ncbi:MAG: alpha/beta hydrolase [Acetobacteraceae bacterium]